MRHKYKFMIFFVVVFFLASNAFALGITPAVATLNFEPNLEKTLSFKILNNENKEFRAYIYVKGEMNKTVSLTKTVVTLDANESSKEIFYKISLPAQIEKPGYHLLDIVVMELPPAEMKEGNILGGLIAVAHRLNIKVPYPGTYAEASVDVAQTMVNETADFKVDVFNFGKEKINAKADVEIFGPTYERIASLTTNEKTIEPSKEERLVARWKADVNPGTYHAVVKVSYDGKMIRLEKNFGIGAIFIDILNISNPVFELGGVSKFEILIENKWNQEIKDVFAEIVLETGEKFRSASIDIGPMERKTMIAYWDTKRASIGTLKGKIILHYSGRVTEKEIEMQITPSGIVTQIGGRIAFISAPEIGIWHGIIALIIVLIVINMAWFFYFKKRK